MSLRCPALQLWPLFFLLAPATVPAEVLKIEVRDPSGAAVQTPGRVENQGTGGHWTFTTDAQGQATLADLPAGRYRVFVDRSGFAPSASLAVVSANAPATHTVQLEVGSAGFQLEVTASTALAGAELSAEQLPSPVQTLRDTQSGSPVSLAGLLNNRLNGVFLNEVQGNPWQPDLNYRGYTASPLLGTPQGLSLYLDGVRMNQAFGDVVNWDLIPKAAIAETSLIAGSNPLFGLNTLGGAIAVTSKDGYGAAGTALTLGGGSFGRRTGELEHGGHRGAWNWFGATSLFFEDGWRQSSPSNVRQFFGRLGRQMARTSVHLSLSYANNHLLGNGLQETRLLAQDYSSIYTKPDINANRSPMAVVNLRHAFTGRVTFSGNAYYRYVRTRALNGDINEGSLDQSVYQPSAADQAALRAAGYTGFPTAGATAANTPFPSWRCIAQALLRDEPGEKCNGLINRNHARTTHYGLSGQVTWLAPRRNQFTLGASADRNRADFEQSTQLGYLAPDRSVIGVNAFADGVTGGDVDGEPFDNRVNLHGRTSTASVYATDTLTIQNKLHVTLSGRLNRTAIDNLDRLRPRAGAGSLSGSHAFTRFNPAAGFAYALASPVSAYFNYAEGSRAPTSIELGCADPNEPCKLPNALAGDPPLRQVVARTLEAGLRSRGERRLGWSAGWFRAANRDDILFVASPQTGFGYFKNFGKTLRQGLELSGGTQFSRLHVSAGYTLLQATFASPELVLGSGNSSSDAPAPGLEGNIRIRPGDRVPLIPRHMGKIFAEFRPTAKASLDLGVNAFSSAYARGNEDNLHRPDGRYYVGPGASAGYAVVNLGGRYRLHRSVELWAQINNLLDKRYASAAQLGPAGITPAGSYIARPLPAVNGEFPVVQSTFLAPGAPRGVWGGLKLRF